MARAVGKSRGSMGLPPLGLPGKAEDMVRITSLKRGARPKLDRTSRAGYSGERVVSRPIASNPQLMALASAALEEPQGTLYRAGLRDQTPAQGPKFSLRGKTKFGPMEVGAKHPHDSVLREFRGLIVSQTYLGYVKGASPRSYFSSTKTTQVFNDSVRYFTLKLDRTDCIHLSTAI
jgi:hypothetical protein